MAKKTLKQKTDRLKKNPSYFPEEISPINNIQDSTRQVVYDAPNSSNDISKRITEEITTTFDELSNPHETFSSKKGKEVNNFLYGTTFQRYDESIGGNPEDNYSLTIADKI